MPLNIYNTQQISKCNEENVTRKITVNSNLPQSLLRPHYVIRDIIIFHSITIIYPSTVNIINLLKFSSFPEVLKSSSLSMTNQSYCGERKSLTQYFLEDNLWRRSSIYESNFTPKNKESIRKTEKGIERNSPSNSWRRWWKLIIFRSQLTSPGHVKTDNLKVKNYRSFKAYTRICEVYKHT